MNLLQDKDAYKEFIESTSAELGLTEIQVEKDYMVSCLLNKISAINSLKIVFKGQNPLASSSKSTS